MREIPLTKGKVAFVSDADYERVSQYKWCYHSAGYAYRGKWDNRIKNNRAILMHRFILNPPANKQIDHINRNKLDNRRENLRICDQTTNNHNKASKGVTRSYKKWVARFVKYGKTVYRGSFDTREEASEAYKKAKEKYAS